MLQASLWLVKKYGHFIWLPKFFFAPSRFLLQGSSSKFIPETPRTFPLHTMSSVATEKVRALRMKTKVLCHISLHVAGIFTKIHSWDPTHIPCTCYEFSWNQRKSKGTSLEGHSTYSAVSLAPVTGTFSTYRNLDTTCIAYMFRWIGEELRALYVKTEAHPLSVKFWDWFNIST
jgi:hypothetical protein